MMYLLSNILDDKKPFVCPSAKERKDLSTGKTMIVGGFLCIESNAETRLTTDCNFFLRVKGY